MAGNAPSAVLAEFAINIAGQELEGTDLASVHRVEIERGLRQPDKCVLIMADPQRTWATENRPGHGDTVEVRIPYEGKEVTLFTGGRVGRLDVTQEAGEGTHFHVVSYGPRYTLGKGVKAQAYEDAEVGVNLGDAAKGQGVQGKVEATPNRPYMLQANVANRGLIEEFAARTGLIIQEEGSDLFLAPPNLDPAEVTLTYGIDLVQYRVEVNTIGPVAALKATAHDYARKDVWVHEVTSHKGSATGWDKAGSAIIGEAFGETPTEVSDLPVKSQAELEQMAQALFDDKAFRFITGEGSALGLPALKPGRLVNIEKLGKRLSGAYFVTRTVHRLSRDDGYSVFFEACRPAWGE